MKNIEDGKIKELMRLEKALSSQEAEIEKTKTLLSSQKEERERLVTALREEVRTLDQIKMEFVPGSKN